MKQFLLSAVCMTVAAFGLQAQSSFKITDWANNDVTGTTIQVYVDTMGALTLNYNVKNISANSTTSKGRKMEVSMATGCSLSICYAGTCYGSSVYTTPCKPHNTGTTNVLTADFNAGHTFSTSTFRLAVYNCGNGSDSAFVIVVVNPTPAGIRTLDVHATIGEPYPNPANSMVNFNYQIANSNGQHVQLIMNNLLGSLVKTLDISETSGTAHLDVADLDAGMYFYTILVNNKAVATKKIIIKR